MLTSSVALPRLSKRAMPSINNRTLILVIVLVILGVALFLALVIFIALRLMKRRLNRGFGAYEGALVHPEHLAAQISPFGASGPHAGRNIPRFIHTPGENMRVAFRRPDGAWHFADSLTPFAPAGVNDIDVLPSPSASTSDFSFHGSTIKEGKLKTELEPGYGFPIDQFPLPPPAYHRDPYKEQFHGDGSQV